MNDLRFGLRVLRKSPVFTAVSVLTLSLGIGAVTTLFSVVHATLLEPLPFRNGEELVLVWASNPAEGQDRYFVSPQDFADWRELNTTFQGMSAYWPTPVAITDLDGGPTRASAVYVTENYFDVMGGSALLGRTFTRDDGPGSQQLVILSEALWDTRFGADPEIIGKSLVVDGAAVEVAGVLRREFTFPEGTDLWLNITFPMSIQSRYARWMSVVGRLAVGIPPVRAEEDLDRIASLLAEIHPANLGWQVGMNTLRGDLVGDTGRALWVLLGATGLILLISCANVASLLLSRSESRGLEVAIRTAVGASRGRIGRQLITESLLLAGLGAGVGVGGAWTAVKLLPALAPGVLPFTAQVSLDPIVMAVAVLVTLLSGLLFGLAPLIRMIQGKVFSPLKEGTRGTAGVRRVRLQTGFVIGQLALATILTVGAGLLARSYSRLQSVDVGFQPAGVLTFEIDLSPTVAETDTDVAQTYEAVLEGLSNLPGVQEVGGTSELPLTGTLDYSQPFIVDDRLSVDAEETRAFFRHVTPEFFSSMRVPILEGRSLEALDRLNVPGVVVVNETLAERYWPDESPVGRRISNTAYRWGPLGAVLVSEAEVVGVVRDIRYEGIQREAQPALYFNYQQAPVRRMALTVRSTEDPEALIPRVRQAVAEVDPNLPVSNLRTMQSVVNMALARDRFSTILLSTFGLVALILAAVGVYGVLSYSVEQRVPEVGIRMALGASRESVRGLILREGAVMVGLGLLLGLIGALALGNVIASQLFGISARDPLVLAGVLLVLAVIGILASGIPAQRATRVDPMQAMRGE